MLTKKIRALRKKIAPRQFVGFELSKQIMNELLDHCDPTAIEFGRMTEGVIIDGSDLFRLILKLSHTKKPASQKSKRS